MFPLKLVRSLVSGDNVTNNPLLLRIHHDDLDESDDNHCIATQSRTRIPLMLFAPTQELVKDTYRLASIARVIGMDLRPNPSLSHIIFSWPSPPPPCPPSSSSSTSSSSWGRPLHHHPRIHGHCRTTVFHCPSPLSPLLRFRTSDSLPVSPGVTSSWLS
ncbi:UNVERIFIED_CONTAM: hypothetical protein Sangu_1210000 [Sesamum angustifolium]|uniref:Uncharacterized protein n=1 Tax=Sesamum angustifolium TaxID=2727405 RepID=A0AAW2NL28_9LAMI